MNLFHSLPRADCTVGMSISGSHQVLKSISVTGPNQSPIQQVPRVLSLGLSDRGVRITVNLYQLSRARMTGAITLLPLYAFSTFQQLFN